MEKKALHLSVRISEETKLLLQKYADSHEWSLSYAAERIIRSYLIPKNEVLKESEQRFSEDTPQSERFNISKYDQNTIYNVCKELDLSNDEAIRYILTYFDMSWPMS